MKLPFYDVFAKYKPFEIVKTDNNTIILQSQVIPAGKTKGYKVMLMFDFNCITDFEYKEELDNKTGFKDNKLFLTIDNAQMDFIEVDRNETTS